MAETHSSEDSQSHESGKTKGAVLLFVAGYITVAVVAIGSFWALM